MYKEKSWLRYTKPISLYIIFVLVGSIITLIDINYFQSPGFAGILTSWIVAPQAAQQMKDLIENSVGSPASFLAERRFLTELYMEKTKNAKQIDIIALSMQVFLEQHRDDDLIEWIVRQVVSQMTAGKSVSIIGSEISPQRSSKVDFLP